MTRMSIDVTSDLHKKIKFAAMLNELSIKDYVTQALYDKLEQDIKDTPNSLTEAVFDESDAGKNLKRLSNIHDLFKDL
ncbi:MAG: Antitoxin ParD [Rickettsiaceae bacterium]|jgi:hypothetical protein|nr:Antitoxin ParD [Rickettsiaceae bacterium]